VELLIFPSLSAPDLFAFQWQVILLFPTTAGYARFTISAQVLPSSEITLVKLSAFDVVIAVIWLKTQSSDTFQSDKKWLICWFQNKRSFN